MKISNRGIELVKKWEGCYLKTYADIGGVLTIGYGHTGKDVTKGLVITKERALELLKKDMEYFEKVVNKYDSKYHFTRNEFDALVSFAFNVGEGNLKLLLKNGERSKKEVAEKITAYCNCNGKRVQGLLNRRIDEQKMFRSSENTDYEKIARDVISGKYGNGNARKTNLEKAGYDYNVIQSLVNKLLKEKK